MTKTNGNYWTELELHSRHKIVPIQVFIDPLKGHRGYGNSLIQDFDQFQ